MLKLELTGFANGVYVEREEGLKINSKMSVLGLFLRRLGKVQA